MENKPDIIKNIRQDSSTATSQRRKIAALSAVGLVDFSIISLYQLGYIRSLPDLPGKIFDSNKVNASKDAVILGLPDGPLTLGMYALNIVVASAASKLGKTRNLFDYLLGGLVVAQAAGAAHYLINMATVQKKACPYCIIGALINFATLQPLRHLLGNAKNKFS